MDLKNLCSKINMDGIKAKLPNMPTMPAIPQIRIPKSIPRLKTRKIFRSSREDVNKNVSPKHMQAHPTAISLTAGAEPADFINSTPTRISTISSLMKQATGGRYSGSSRERNDGGGGETKDTALSYEHSTYRSAHSIDDDYPSPRTVPGHRGVVISHSPIQSPINMRPINVKPHASDATASNLSVKMSFSEKLQKGYKDLSEFRLKHILAKKTVVRTTSIDVDHYAKRYDEDRAIEEEEQLRRDQEIAENYRFNFKESRQNTIHSNSLSPNDSPLMQTPPQPKLELVEQHAGRLHGKSVSEQSGDESGMETTPPKRKPGIVTTQFTNVRNSSMQKSFSDEDYLDDEDDDDDEDMRERFAYGKSDIRASPTRKAQSIPSTVWALKETQETQVRTSREEINEPPKVQVRKAHKERMRRLTSQFSSSHEFGSIEETDITAKTETTQKTLNEKSENPLNVIKQNLKRFKSTLSIKQKTQNENTTAAGTTATDDDSEDEETRAAAKQSTNKSPSTTREKLAARLQRFKSREASTTVEDANDIEYSPKKTDNRSSPIRAAINNKLQTWKKSFKKNPTDAGGTGDEASPEKKQQQSRSSTLINKLKYIRSRKNPNSKDELDATEDDEDENEAVASKKEKDVRKSSNLEEKFENARQRTLKKVNDKMQKIKFFHKSQEQVTASKEVENVAPTTAESTPSNVPAVISRRGGIQYDYDEDVHSSELDESEELHDECTNSTQKINAAWTTKPILSDSTESEDNDVEYPRVLIHQDHSDMYESTIIIAVTTSAAPQSPHTPRITEIVSETTPESSPEKKALNWIPNKEIITGFLEMTPPSTRKLSSGTEVAAPTICVRGHARKLSMDSNSDSDSWMPENVRNKQFIITNPEGVSRRTSIIGLNSIQENEEAWRVHTTSSHAEEKLHKAKSIDIFELNDNRGAFEDFDDAIKNEPVLRIATNSISFNESFERDSSEDPDAADDDNTSRVTKIYVEAIKKDEEQQEEKCNSVAPTVKTEYQKRQIGNSRESLDANFDENEELYTDEEADDDVNDRPPSAAPSPPPSTLPPPPPLPQRQPSIRLSNIPVLLPTEVLPPSSPPPPLPTSKPPVRPTKPPPKIPERAESMRRLAKPLVKTSSLRLTYTEQVKPSDVGKVNKLISRFEPSTAAIRPRVIPRNKIRTESEEYSEDEEQLATTTDGEDEEVVLLENEEDVPNAILDTTATVSTKDESTNNDRDVTQTPKYNPATQDSVYVEPTISKITRPALPVKRIAPIPVPILARRPLIQKAVITNNIENNLVVEVEIAEEELITTTMQSLNIKSSSEEISQMNVPKIAFDVETNNSSRSSTLSRPSSDYGSPLQYPSSLMGSTETTPTPGRRQHELRTPRRVRGSRSSVARENNNNDDQYYSFDSDEENSYYSISSTGSGNRYVVEI